MLKTSPSEMGVPANSFRLALGALIIKEKLGTSDPWNSRKNSRQPLFTIVDPLGNLQQRTAISIAASSRLGKESAYGIRTQDDDRTDRPYDRWKC